METQGCSSQLCSENVVAVGCSDLNCPTGFECKQVRTVACCVVENGLPPLQINPLQIPRVVGRLVDSIWGLLTLPSTPLGDVAKMFLDRDFMTISLTQLVLN